MKLSTVWRSRVVSSALAVLLGASMSNWAHAVFVEADRIAGNGASSTVDLWFFSFAGAADTSINVNFVDPLIAGIDPDLIIYFDDGSFSNIFGSDTAAGGNIATVPGPFPAGSYIGVVANHPLIPGEFGPFHGDAALAVGNHEYEFHGPAPGDALISLNCVLSGNLDGTYTERVLAADTCRLPPAQVPEPAALALLSIGLIGLAAARRRPTRKTRGRSP